MQVRVNYYPQQLCYLLPTFTADIRISVLVSDYSEPQPGLPLHIPSDILIVRLGTPPCIFVRSAVLYYVNCCQLLSASGYKKTA